MAGSEINIVAWLAGFVIKPAGLVSTLELDEQWRAGLSAASGWGFSMQTVQHRLQAVLLAKHLGLCWQNSIENMWPALHSWPTGCRLAAMHQGRLLGMYCMTCHGLGCCALTLAASPDRR